MVVLEIVQESFVGCLYETEERIASIGTSMIKVAYLFQKMLKNQSQQLLLEKQCSSNKL